MAGTLYVVATPIGTLGDITERVVRVLAEVDVVLAEDTRVSAKLLGHLGITGKRLMTFNQYTARNGEKVAGIAEMLASGLQIALVSDAGTPGISDPGNELIDKLYKLSGSASSKFLETPPDGGLARISHPAEPVRYEGEKAAQRLATKSEEASTFEQSIFIVPVPGPSAVTAALSVCGFDVEKYTFIGFMPKKKREKLVASLIDSKLAFVYFDSPHRVVKNLEFLTAKLAPERRVFVGRELTKLHETHYRGAISDVLAELSQKPVKGEIVVVVEK